VCALSSRRVRRDGRGTINSSSRRKSILEYWVGEKLALFKDLIIGSKAEVYRSLDPSLLGKKGTIVDETKNMVVLSESDRRTQIPKAVVQLKIRNDRGIETIVDGRDLLAAPQERLKN
jgi:ribonuclease P protein subunit POP4